MRASVNVSLAYLEMQRDERKDKSFEILYEIVEDAQAFRIG